MRRFIAGLALAALIALSGVFAAAVTDRRSSAQINLSQNTAVSNRTIKPAAAGNINAQADYKAPLSLTTPHQITDCTYQPVPYRTVNKIVAWLPPGQTVVTGGVDGEEQICGASTGSPVATIIIPPTNKIIAAGAAAALPASTASSNGQSSQENTFCQAGQPDSQPACPQPDTKTQ